VSDDDISPELQALLGIGAELTAIRRELVTIRQALVDDASDDETDNATVACRCGAAFDDRDTAAAHAREEHDAPRGAEQDLLTET